MIYLDNAATSFPKPRIVIDEIERCMREYCANPGRGGHKLSLMSGRAVLETRETLCRLFNIKNPMQLCFTKNATEAINIALYSMLTPGSHVITTHMEHNSVMRPIMTLQRDVGIELTVIDGDNSGLIDPGDIAKNVKKNTALVVSTLSSNVNGMVMPVKEIGKAAGEAGIPFLLDASQGAGAIPVDVEDMNISLLAFPGHKGLFGPQGTGGLYAREGLSLKPIMSGGTGSNSESVYQPEFMPDYLESGTLNTPGIVGLGTGVRFLLETGIENIESRKWMLVKRLYNGLKDTEGIIFYSSPIRKLNSGIVAINIKGMDSTEVSFILDKDYGIATRAGLHCAPMAHRHLGTEYMGIVRLSPSFFNTSNEIDKTIDAIKKISLKIVPS